MKPIFLLAGFVLTAVVTLDSIKIYRTHEWLSAKPTVYFKCKGEKETILPDVKEKNTEYAFKGEESWQVYHLRYTPQFVFCCQCTLVKCLF